MSALEYLGTGDFRIESIAARHVDAMLEADPVGPYFLGGFCYGAVIAREMARQLASRQRDVAFLVLLGITPLDFPTLVSPDAAERWKSYVGSGPPLVRDVRRITCVAPPSCQGAKALATSRAGYAISSLARSDGDIRTSATRR